MTVTATPEDDRVRFKVPDTGIEPVYFEQIFTISQGLHSLEACESSGIGLAITRKIAQRHGRCCTGAAAQGLRHRGIITATSTSGEGTTFAFTLPAALDGSYTGLAPEDQNVRVRVQVPSRSSWMAATRSAGVRATLIMASTVSS